MLLGNRMGHRARHRPGTRATQLRDEAMVVGLLLYTATGGFVDALLIAPPLTTIDDSENEYLIERLDRALQTVETKPAKAALA
jgi:hypothetical protein